MAIDTCACMWLEAPHASALVMTVPSHHHHHHHHHHHQPVTTLLLCADLHVLITWIFASLWLEEVSYWIDSIYSIQFQRWPPPYVETVKNILHICVEILRSISLKGSFRIQSHKKKSSEMSVTAYLYWLYIMVVVVIIEKKSVANR